MASIASSLGGGGGGGGSGRRNAGSSSTGSTLQHHSSTINNGGNSNNSLRSSPSTDTLRSSGKLTPQNVVMSNGINNQIRSEIDLLRKIIQDKDSIIQTWISFL